MDVTVEIIRFPATIHRFGYIDFPTDQTGVTPATLAATGEALSITQMSIDEPMSELSAYIS